MVYFDQLAIRTLTWVTLSLFAGLVSVPTLAHSEERPTVVSNTVIVTSQVRAPLGSFAPTPTLFLGGSEFSNGGYTPLSGSPRRSILVHGPVSAYRAVTVTQPLVTTDFRGGLTVTEGYQFVYPYYPRVFDPIPSPRPRLNRITPTSFRSRSSRPSGINWYDFR